MVAIEIIFFIFFTSVGRCILFCFIIQLIPVAMTILVEVPDLDIRRVVFLINSKFSFVTTEQRRYKKSRVLSFSIQIVMFDTCRKETAKLLV